MIVDTFVKQIMTEVDMLWDICKDIDEVIQLLTK